jgi:hypothetical protein
LSEARDLTKEIAVHAVRENDGAYSKLDQVNSQVIWTKYLELHHQFPLLVCSAA